MNVNDIIHSSEIYGPGLRTVIWVQGCSIRCKGCWNNSMWSFTPNKILEPSDIVDSIIEHKSDGVTILGGEPLDQLDELSRLLIEIKKRTLMGVIVYTGYQSGDSLFEERCGVLKEHGTDVLIAGRYNEAKRDISTGIMGSSNQKVILLTDRYSMDDIVLNKEVVEIEINEFGALCFMGYPTEETLRINS